MTGCEYLSGQLCKTITKGTEGESTRRKSCVNKLKDACCYFCFSWDSCEISCHYKGNRVDVRTQAEDIDRKITEYKEKADALSFQLAEREIGEQTYQSAVRVFQNKIDQLNEEKERLSPFGILNPPELPLSKSSSSQISSRTSRIDSSQQTEASKYRGYVRKLDDKHRLGEISEEVYQKLKSEYEGKLRELERR